VRILNLSLGQDTGGQQGRLQDAWPKHFPEDEYLSLTSTKTFYPIKHRLNLSELMREHWPWSEVLHLNNDLRYLDRFRRLQPSDKALVIHHHGTMFRTRLDYHLEALERFRATAIMSTVDLWALAPEQTTWQPQTYELEELQSYRDPIDDDIIRIAHAPTNRGIKGTAALEQAVRRLQKDGAPVELTIIERQSNQKCLRLKGQADIYVDQMILGYGCNAIEAWGMGIPVIAGVDPELARSKVLQTIPLDTRDRMLQLWGDIPFMESTEDGLYVSLSKMLQPGTRKHYAAKGMRHFMRFHESSTSTDRLRQVYALALSKVT